MKTTIKLTNITVLSMCALLLSAATALFAGYGAAEPTAGATPEEAGLILIQNVNVFDGVNEKLIENASVLVEGNLIKRLATGTITAPESSTVIDSGGRTMTPGFIAAHEHIVGQMPFSDIFNQDTRYYAYVATQTANTYLMNGFTAIRDIGNSFSLRLAIDRGYVVGPRIYTSGPMISQTGGHADHRHNSDASALIGGTWDPMVRYGDMAVVDGVPEVLKAAREALRMGASQVKIAVGGGTGSYADPLEVTEFTPEEIRAAVQAAEDYGTYVMAHVYNSKGIRRAVENGVKSIEHGQLVDEETLRYMKEKDAWLSPQVIVFTFIPKGFTEDQANKHRQAYDGIDNMFKICKKIGFTNIVFGSDIITDPEAMRRINEEFVLRTKWFTPAEILRQATSKGGELLAMSGPKNPYKAGPLGVIKEGAYADLLLINGNPLEDISILTKPEENLALIMKDGKIYKNTVN